MKNIRRLSLAIIASFVLSMAVFASPPVPTERSVSIKSSNTAQATVSVTTTDLADRSITEGEQVVKLNGKSTYALSTCPATFTAIANTIERFAPATPPPVS